jgi:gluconate 5-dehydrogenase
MNIAKLFDLSGKVAIVTGGSRGIGKEMAIGLGEAGAKVTITARREEWLLPAYEEIQCLGIECLMEKADIATEEDIERVINQTIKRWGKIDILVNNAGITWGESLETMPLDKWDSVMNTNAKGTLICSRLAGKQMIKQKCGSIINVASMSGVQAVDPKIMQAIGYQASKAAIIVMTKQFAVEWAKHNIRVNAIAPYFFKTRMSKESTERAEKEMIESIPMNRLGREGELKGAVVFLASEASSYITGQVLNIDGGLSAW